MVTIHKQHHEELASKELTECAHVIKATGLLYRWKKYYGPTVLCAWESTVKLFTHFSNESLREWLGTHFDLQETTGIHFGLPAEAVADRIWQTLLLNTIDLPWASWQLTTQYRIEKLCRF
ncbi:MAG TPA: hypothetical protein VN939_22550 [Chthoniobacterales bacterium]|nr:hypothetical protein [Chthoniobacterales bacterium]